ncbi:MAG: tetratricopeptide repeat protein [Planctomycetaceae bacterium]|nr:tetratricopeptide repeat protein [Planctomycetaceae bacterium]
MDKEILALENAAEQLRSEKKYHEAVEKYAAILSKDPNFVRAHLALAVVYYNLQDFEKSVAHGEKAVELEPNDPFNHVAMSVTYQRAFEGTRDPAYIQRAETAKARAHMR